MHELGLAQNILEIVAQTARENNLVRVTSVQLDVGPLAGVEPETLTFAWGFASRGTVAEGSALTIHATPLLLYCRACDNEYVGDVEDLRCPSCQGETFDVRAGRELLLRAIEGDPAACASQP